jgi:Zn-dependent protease with chaperone function
LYVVAGWTGLLVLLFLAGWIMSRITLRTAYRGIPQDPGETGGVGRLVRVAYRTVIALTSVLFYFSIPLLIVLVSGAAIRILYDLIVEGRAPVGLVVVVELATLFALYYAFRRLFAKTAEEEPGRRLSRREAPQLWKLVERVAERVGTRPVGWIYITPGTEIAVLERGGPLRKLSGRGRRCLLLGLGALPGLRRGPFESILAHEYGHFTNRDTAGGDVATRVSHSTRQMSFMMSMSGLNRWYNPAWWFLNGFSSVFLRVTAGASRLQEILADRHAALAYGVDQFVGGLQHIVRQSLVFSRQVANEVESAQREDRDIRNVYTLPPVSDTWQQDQIEKTYNEVMSRAAAPYDSHPSPRERVELLRGLETAAVAPADDVDLWELMGDTPRLQEEMTHVIQKNVNLHREMMPSGGDTAGGTTEE